MKRRTRDQPFVPPMASHRSAAEDRGLGRRVLERSVAVDEVEALFIIRAERNRIGRERREARQQPKPVTLARFSWDK